MPRYVSLLRGINVGGHRITMDELRRHFVALKFADIETFIASGNVLFDTASTDLAALETKIERHLARALGYEVPTFLRTLPELAAVAEFPAFAKSDMTNADYSRYAYFLRAAPDATVQQRVVNLRCATDEFCVHGREIFWLCRGKISEESQAWQPFEKVLRAARVIATSRNLNMVRKLVATHLLPAAAPAPAPRAGSRKTRATLDR